MAKLTIHTATYNRGYILTQAYDSLKRQTSKDFEWIITDDGSTDDTEGLVKQWCTEENGFVIVYNKLSHVGIPRALNSGVQKANTEWFMMLDSDDYLEAETVEKIIPWIEEIEEDMTFAGIGFAKCQPDGNYMKNQIPRISPATGYVDATNIERDKYGLDMDMCEVQRVSLYRKYPFLVWEGETYAPEQLSYNNIALAGFKIRWRSEKLYRCEYLPDGQTRNNSLVKRNPMGFAMMYEQNITRSVDPKTKWKNAVQMVALSIVAGHLDYAIHSKNRLWVLLALPAGAVLAQRRKNQFKRMN